MATDTTRWRNWKPMTDTTPPDLPPTDPDELVAWFDLRRDRHRREVIEPRQRGEQVRPDWCVCHDSYWMRGRDDPNCRHDVIEELHDRITELGAQLAESCDTARADGVGCPLSDRITELEARVAAYERFCDVCWKHFGPDAMDVLWAEATDD